MLGVIACRVVQEMENFICDIQTIFMTYAVFDKRSFLAKYWLSVDTNLSLKGNSVIRFNYKMA